MKAEKNRIEDLLTPEEVCALLKIKKQRLYEWVHFEKIPYIKIGRFLRFSGKRIKEWLEENTHDTMEENEIRSE